MSYFVGSIWVYMLMCNFKFLLKVATSFKKYHVIVLLATSVSKLTELDGMTNSAHFLKLQGPIALILNFRDE